MAPFIANMIIKARAKSFEAGRQKYRAYFIKTKLYAEYQADVDAELISHNCSDVIVTE